jgi:hypothetical protein
MWFQKIDKNIQDLTILLWKYSKKPLTSAQGYGKLRSAALISMVWRVAARPDIYI